MLTGMKDARAANKRETNIKTRKNERKYRSGGSVVNENSWRGGERKHRGRGKPSANAKRVKNHGIEEKSRCSHRASFVTHIVAPRKTSMAEEI